MEHNFKRIAMLSTHGYFDPVPQLGRTDTGGQVVYVLELAKAIAKKGIPVDIFTRWFEKEKQQIDPVPGYENVRVIRIPAGSWEFLPKEEIYGVLPELTENMIEFINNNQLEYDLFHGHYVDAGIVAVHVAQALKKPSFFTAHSLGAWKRQQMGGDPNVMEKKFNFKQRIAEEKRIFRSVNAQSVTSIVQKKKLAELYDFEKRIEVIPPGVDIHTYNLPDDSNEVEGIDLPKPYIYCLSRIDSNKGHDLLLHAFGLVRKEIDCIHLVIGGGSPNPKPREIEVFENMHRIIDMAGLNDCVKIIGYVPDNKMLPYYQGAEFFVMPSIFEPFGMTSQESMACGKPVIASKFGGIRNAINSGKNGFLVDPTNKEEFAEAMVRLLKNDEERERIGKAAHKTIMEEYSWEAIADRFLSFFDEYINT